VRTNAQPNITSVGTLTSLAVTGNVIVGNVTASGYHLNSVDANITATGTTQGTAYALTKEINIVATVLSGNGVVLPAALVGMSITVINTSANTSLVYPASGAKINDQATDAAFSLPANATLQFVSSTTTKWFTVGIVIQRRITP
jgi:hypothetical protein